MACHTPTIYNFETLPEQKAFLRKRAKTALKEYCSDSALMEQCSASALNSLVSSVEYKNASMVLGFMPMFDELDITPILQKALDDGKTVAVPRMSETGNDMEFYIIQSMNDSFTTDNKYKIKEPALNLSELKPEQIDSSAIILVPGLVFNLEGARLGRGKGYYDKYLSRIPEKTKPVLCGCTFTICVTKAIPMEENDFRVNYMLNEYGFISLSQQNKF